MLAAYSLDIAHLPQQEAHWSGPAAVRMALGTRLRAAAPTQWWLAQRLCTDETDLGAIRDILNALLQTKRYAVHDRPELFRHHLTHTVGTGWPIVAALRGRRIVAIGAYADGGEITRVADPASRQYSLSSDLLMASLDGYVA